jgi:crotonobetainyl-CoA:carnitine CoA-transferase CaiB-like acyl-CoA transferase
MTDQSGLLDGLKVLELAQLIAGPMAGSLMADLGADVVHVEDPRVGDPQRATGVAKDGVYLWWKVSGRNKRSLTLDLRSPEGQSIARQLVGWADVVVTNFRPGTLERWGLDWETLHVDNPKLVMLQISGFGNNTTLRDRPGFGKVGEAMSGVVNITGWADGPPLHTGFSHADSTTGLFGAYAVMAALHRRAQDPDFQGELIDLSLFETLYRLVEWQVIFYDQLGYAPSRAGNQLANAPAAVVNTYQSEDGIWITVTSGTLRSVQRVADLLGEDPSDYDSPTKQYDRRGLIDDLLRKYISTRPAADILEAMWANEVTASRIYDVEDIVNDQTYIEREDIVTVSDAELGSVRMQAALPKLANYPGHIWRTGPALGADTEYVLTQFLGMDAAKVESLREDGVV